MNIFKCENCEVNCKEYSVQSFQSICEETVVDACEIKTPHKNLFHILFAFRVFADNGCCSLNNYNNINTQQIFADANQVSPQNNVSTYF